LLEFITESQLDDEIEIVRCAIGTPQMNAVREKLTAATGDQPKFPTMEIEPGTYRTESDELIDYLEGKYGTNRP
jgi:hypothetical protein